MYARAVGVGGGLPSYEAVTNIYVESPASRQAQGSVRLSDDEVENIDEMATLASIFRATEALEKFFGKGRISADEYTQQCSVLITQFRAQERCLISRKIITNIDAFVKQYMTESTEHGPRVTCDRAYNRLVAVGQPETVINAILSSQKIKAADISDVTTSLITAEDAVSMNIKSIDTLLPLLAQALTNLGRITILKPDDEKKAKVNSWVNKLQTMRADSEISEEDKVALGMDLELTKQRWFEFLRELN